MLARLALEPELARMAALNASPLHLRTLRRLSKSMRAVPTWRAYEELDAAFHATIAEASGNPLLEELHKIMNGVRKVVVWRKLSTQQTAPQPTYHSFDEHDAIVDALEARAGAEAHKQMQRHLESTIREMSSS